MAGELDSGGTGGGGSPNEDQEQQQTEKRRQLRRDATSDPMREQTETEEVQTGGDTPPMNSSQDTPDSGGLESQGNTNETSAERPQDRDTGGGGTTGNTGGGGEAPGSSGPTAPNDGSSTGRSGRDPSDGSPMDTTDMSTGGSTTPTPGGGRREGFESRGGDTYTGGGGDAPPDDTPPEPEGGTPPTGTPPTGTGSNGQNGNETTGQGGNGTEGQSGSGSSTTTESTPPPSWDDLTADEREVGRDFVKENKQYDRDDIADVERQPGGDFTITFTEEAQRDQVAQGFLEDNPAYDRDDITVTLGEDGDASISFTDSGTDTYIDQNYEAGDTAGEAPEGAENFLNTQGEDVTTVYGQGAEVGSGSVAEQAQGIESDILESNPGLTADDVAVNLKDDGSFSVELTESGRQDYAEQQVNRIEGFEEAGGTQPDNAAAEPDQQAFEEAGGMEVDNAVDPTEEAIEEFEQGGAMQPDNAVDTLEQADEIGGDATTYADRELQVGEQQERVRSDVEQQLEQQGVDTDRVDINVERTEGGFSAEVVPEQREQYDDVDWSLGLGDPEKDEVEQFVDETIGVGVGNWVSKNVADPLRESTNPEAPNRWALGAANLVEQAPHLPGAVLEGVEGAHYLLEATPVAGGSEEQFDERAAEAVAFASMAAGAAAARAKKEPGTFAAEALLAYGAGRAISATRYGGVTRGAVDLSAGRRAFGRYTPNTRRVTDAAPDSPRSLDMRSSVTRAKERAAGGISVTRDPDAGVVDIHPDLKAKAKNVVYPDDSGLGRPLATDLGVAGVSTRVVRGLSPSRDRVDLGRPLPTDLGEEAISTRVARRLKSGDGRTDLGRPLSTDLGEEGLSTRATEALRRGDEVDLGRPLSTDLGEEGISSRAVDVLRPNYKPTIGQRPERDLGRPLSTDIGEEGLSVRTINALKSSGDTTDFGRPLATDLGEEGLSTRAFSALAPDYTPTIGRRGGPELGRPLSTDLGETPISTLVSREAQSARFAATERILRPGEDATDSRTYRLNSVFEDPGATDGRLRDLTLKIGYTDAGPDAGSGEFASGLLDDTGGSGGAFGVLDDVDEADGSTPNEALDDSTHLNAGSPSVLDDADSSPIAGADSASGQQAAGLLRPDNRGEAPEAEGGSTGVPPAASGGATSGPKGGIGLGMGLTEIAAGEGVSDETIISPFAAPTQPSPDTDPMTVGSDSEQLVSPFADTQSATGPRGILEERTAEQVDQSVDDIVGVTPAATVRSDTPPRQDTRQDTSPIAVIGPGSDTGVGNMTRTGTAPGLMLGQEERSRVRSPDPDPDPAARVDLDFGGRDDSRRKDRRRGELEGFARRLDRSLRNPFTGN